jgi:hypothetical protein
MTYRRKKKCMLDKVCSNYQGHEELEEQKLKKRSKSNLQTRNKTRLCNSKTKTQGLITRTCDVQNKRENIYLLCYHMQTWTWKEHDKVVM